MKLFTKKGNDHAFEKSLFTPVALKKAKIAYNFGLSECNRVKKEF